MTFGQPVSLSRTATMDFGPHRIVIGWPEMPPPPGGYGAIYAMDAGWTFGSLRDGLHVLGGDGAGQKMRPTVIVAVGYPTPDMTDPARRGHDLTGAGRQALLDALCSRIVPQVEARLPVDPAHRMILGHSFGGAFALRAGFERRDLFSHVAAGSPSIWTAPEMILRLTKADPATRPATLVTIGALEDPDRAEAAGHDRARIERLRVRDMVGRARAVAQVCAARFIEFPGVDHGGALAPFLSEAIRFLGTGSRIHP